MKKKKYTHSIRLRAQQDFSDGKAWYRSRKVRRLSTRFTADVLLAIRRILSNPYTFAVRYRDTRVCHTDVFPCTIHFVVDEAVAATTITAIIYEGREPALTFNRKEEE